MNTNVMNKKIKKQI